MAMFGSDYETKVTLEDGGTPIEEIPFRALLLGNWSGGNNFDSTDLRQRRPIEIDRDNFDDLMRKLRVEISLDLQSDGENILRLRFVELDDFHPDRIFEQVGLFSNLRETRRRLMNPNTFNQAAREVRDWIGGTTEETGQIESQTAREAAPSADNLLDQILSNADYAAVQTETKRQPKNELDALLGKLVAPYLVRTDEAEQSKLVAAVDEATSELMRQILHHPQFQALEAAWRGAFQVVSRAETNSELKLYLLDAAKDELTADLKAVGNLTQSSFYQWLNREQDESWAIVCGNYVFEPNVDDVATLMRIAQIAANFDAPFVAQAGAKILGIESLAETPDPDDWNLREETAEAKLWGMVRALPESVYLGLAIPRFLARMPYGEKSEPTETFTFEEFSGSPAHENYLWANPSFLCASLIAQTFSSYGWEMRLGAFQDIEDLPLHVYKENGETRIKSPAEINMTQRAAETILEQGLMPLISFRDTHRGRLARFQSIASPPSGLQGKWTK